MKKMVGMALAALLLFICACAQAYPDNTAGVENMPEAVRAIIAESRWCDWEITGWVNPAGMESKRTSQASAFAAVKRGRTNELLAFSNVDGFWAYEWHNAAALPETSLPIILREATEGGGTPRFTSFYDMAPGLNEGKCCWAQHGSAWELVYVELLEEDTHIDADDGVMYFYTNAKDRHVYGEYQRNLRYFSFDAFPKTIEEAREKLSEPPAIPGGTLNAQRIRFTSGERYEVYHGPDEAYGRAANGKALVSTNDWIQVFGEESGFIMIQYDITSEKMRIGWIDADALPAGAEVDELLYEPVNAVTTRKAALTDDPLGAQDTVRTLKEEEEVLWLATMGQWAYVETMDDQPIRGFVRSNLLETDWYDPNTK